MGSIVALHLSKGHGFSKQAVEEAELVAVSVWLETCTPAHSCNIDRVLQPIPISPTFGRSTSSPSNYSTFSQPSVTRCRRGIWARTSR